MYSLHARIKWRTHLWFNSHVEEARNPWNSLLVSVYYFSIFNEIIYLNKEKIQRMTNAHVDLGQFLGIAHAASPSFLKIQFFNVEESDLLVVCQSQRHLTYLSWQKSQNWCSNLVTGLVKVWTKFCISSYSGEKSQIVFKLYYVFIIVTLHWEDFYAINNSFSFSKEDHFCWSILNWISFWFWLLK
jgi:hypothetical protein